jgi:hypothetical protein
MNKREMDRCKARIKKFVDQSTDAEFDALVAEANKFGFRNITRKLMNAWVGLAEHTNKDKIST